MESDIHIGEGRPKWLLQGDYRPGFAIVGGAVATIGVESVAAMAV